MTARLERIYRYLMAEGCTRTHALGLVCAETGVKISDLASRAGLWRGHLNLILSGRRPLRDSVRQAYRDSLGFDPWGMDMNLNLEGNP